MRRVQDHVLEDLKEHVDKLPPRRNLRPYDVVAEMLERYTHSRARGYDLDDFVNTLERHGIKLSRTTVRNYLSRARAEHRKRGQHASRPHTSPVSVAESRKPSVVDTQPPPVAVSARPAATQPQPSPAAPSTSTTTVSTTTVDGGEKTSEPKLRPGQWVMTPDRERL